MSSTFDMAKSSQQCWVKAGLAKELPTIISTPPIQDPQPYTLVTPDGHRLLDEFHRLGMN